MPVNVYPDSPPLPCIKRISPGGGKGGIREETQKPGKALYRLTSKINTKKETQKEKEGKGKNLQSCGKKKKKKKRGIGGGGFRGGAVFVGGRG